jgi:hypothetical protein
LKTPVWIGSFSDRRSVEFLGAAEVEKPSAYYLQAQKLHGKGHFAGNLESYLLDLSTLTPDPAGRLERAGRERAKNYTRLESFYFPEGGRASRVRRPLGVVSKISLQK